MQVLFTSHFEKQIRKLRDKNLAKNIVSVILEVKNAPTLSSITELKKLKGSSNAYRIKLGNYRIGLHISNDIVEFVCFMDRKEIYRYFL